MLHDAKRLLGGAFHEWKDDDAPQWSAALAYYASLAMAPLLLLLVMVASLVWPGGSARQHIVDVIQRDVGGQGADVARLVLQGNGNGGGTSGFWAGALGVAFLLLGATGVFAQLQNAMNEMWEVEPEEGGLKSLVKGRILGFLMILGLGALLLVAVAAQTTLSSIAGGAWMWVLNQVLSVALFTVVFAAVFRTLPDVKIGWKTVWTGAAATAVLFTLGQYLVGLYLGHSSVGSRYGTAGTLVAFLVWLYYSAMVFFYGAELTQVWARLFGEGLEPEEGARRIGSVELGGQAGGAGGDGAKPERRTPPERPRRTRVRGEASYL